MQLTAISSQFTTNHRLSAFSCNVTAANLLNAESCKMEVEHQRSV
jgi:hypothetical protein